MTKIIKSVRKELLNEEFSKKGLSTELTDIKVRLKQPLEEMFYKDIQGALYQAMLRRVREQIKQAESFEDFQELAEKVSFGQEKIIVESLNCDEQTAEGREDLSSLKLLQAAMKLPRQSSDKDMIEMMDKYVPLKVTKTTLDAESNIESEVGYTTGKGKISKRYFSGRWRLTTDTSRQTKAIYSLENRFARALYTNSVERFIKDNQTLLKIRIIEEITHRYSEGNIIKLPNDDVFAKAIKGVGMDYNLFPEGSTFETSMRRMSEFRPIFFLDMTDDGFIPRFHQTQFELIVPSEMIKQMEYLVSKTERQLGMESNYAKSFQTKKHINKKTQSVMDDNEFLSKYGYVEIDNDVDLKLFGQLQKDFKQLCQKVHIPTTKDHSFRIKKLGRHKAAGLYYPAPIKSIIFDLDHPSAYIHELGHLIDYTLLEGEQIVSESLLFRKVLNAYKKILDEQVSKLDVDDPFRKKWNGKSKYNRSYYFQPTEVFARSYELYIFHKGIRSSFLKEDYSGSAYTHDEKYIEMITSYFDDLLSGLPIDTPEDSDKQIKQSPIKVASQRTSLSLEEPSSIFIESEECSNGQLSLF